VIELSPGDNPPIGLLPCIARDHALIEYATAGLDDKLLACPPQREAGQRPPAAADGCRARRAERPFVTRYQLQPASKEELERVLEAGPREGRT
jgi:hypothetical protein